MMTTAIWLAFVGAIGTFEIDKKSGDVAAIILFVACIFATIGVNR
jgi:hypothetical protein